MPDLKSFLLPDVGEGLTEADVLSWSVKPGDTVEVNQVIVEVETAKAAVELPSPYAGVVAELHAGEGDTVEVGRALITIDVAPPGQVDAPPTVQAGPPTAEAGARQPVLVGYGPRSGPAGRRARKAPATAAAGRMPSAPATAATGRTPSVPATPLPPETAVTVVTPSAETAFNVPPAPAPTPEPVHRVLAKPPVRMLAKSLGVNLHSVAPTGPNGSVSRSDVEAAASTPAPEAIDPATSASGTDPDGAAGRRETRVPVRGVRKHTAAAMVASAFTAPHVTEFVTVDVTPMMELRDRVAARREFRDVKVSPLLFVARAVVLATRRTPQINATWDDAAGEIVLKHYVNLGIAAATDRGLLVPNIKDADRLGLLDLAVEIGELTALARSGRTPAAAMTGGTITITNVGVFGVDTGTPILNPGEAGIVAMGAVRRMPWVIRGSVGTGSDGAHGADGSHDGERIVPRWVTQLAVSFDHRLVDGQQGSQFLADVAGVLADPGLAIL